MGFAALNPSYAAGPEFATLSHPLAAPSRGTVIDGVRNRARPLAVPAWRAALQKRSSDSRRRSPPSAVLPPGSPAPQGDGGGSWPLRPQKAIALHGVPGHREGARIIDVNVHLQRLAAVDQVEALDHVQLFGVWRPEAVDKRPVIESDGIDNERIAFVVADRFAVPGCLGVLRMLVGEVDAANVIEAC